MTRVASFSQSQSLLTGMLRNQADVFKAQQQVTTGKRAQDYKGIAADTSTLVTARALKEQADSFSRAGSRVAQALGTNDIQLGAIIDTARNMRQDILQALSSDDATGLPESLEQNFRLIASAINTKVGGGYIFSGSRVTTPPLAVETLDELAALPSAQDAFRNDQLKASARVAESLEMDYGVLADETTGPLMDWLRDLAIFDAGPQGGINGQLTPDHRTYLTNELARLDEAIQAIQSQQVTNGLKQQQIEQLGEQMRDRSVFLETFVSDIEDVNVAEAITRLQNDQTALEASYQAFSTLSNLSLIRFL